MDSTEANRVATFDYADFYERVAKAYPEEIINADSQYWKQNEKVVNDFLGRISGHLVDFGCGKGRFSCRYTKDKVLGIDISPTNIRDASNRHRVKNDRVKRDFVVADITKVMLYNGWQNLICIETLEHVLNPKAALENMHGILAPTGRLLITVPTETGEKWIQSGYLAQYGINDTYFHGNFTLPELEALVAGAGFHIIRSGKISANNIFVEAMKKPNFVLMLCYDNTANIPYMICKSMREHGVKAQLIQGMQSYLNYPLDGTLMVNEMKKQDYLNLVNAADVVIMNETWMNGLYPPIQKFVDSPPLIVYNLLKPYQKVLRIAHGTYFHAHHDEILKTCRQHNIRHMVTTQDLLRYGPGAWLPQFCSDSGGATPVEYTGKIAISHTPTNPVIKSTDMFLEACKAFPELEVVLITKKPHGECLSMRKKCHIHYDQYILGAYGLSAIEGLMIGQVVIVNCRNVLPHSGPVPYIDIPTGDAEGFRKGIRTAMGLVRNREACAAHVKAGYEWARRTHSIESVYKRLMEAIHSTGLYRP